MIANLLKPGRDPREDLPAPIVRTDALTMGVQREGMMLMSYWLPFAARAAASVAKGHS